MNYILNIFNRPFFHTLAHSSSLYIIPDEVFGETGMFFLPSISWLNRKKQPSSFWNHHMFILGNNSWITTTSLADMRWSPASKMPSGHHFCRVGRMLPGVYGVVFLILEMDISEKRVCIVSFRCLLYIYMYI